MKGVILAGGLGTRLLPLTKIINKHLLAVYDKPMVYYPIKTLVEAGITEVLIVVGGRKPGDFVESLENGKEWGIKHLEFMYQKNEGGIAEALALAEDFASDQSLCVILGDNCTDANIKKEVQDFRDGAHIFLKEVPDPERFGVPGFNSGGKIISITEKPSFAASNYAVTGLYIYDNSVFDRIRNLKPSARGELEITDLNNSYLQEKILTWSELNGFWRDAGTFETLFEVNAYWASKRKSTERG